MEIQKVYLTVVGEKMVGDFLALALLDGNKIITVDYHPAFKSLYPKNSKFPCLIITKSGIKRYVTDWENVYSNIYEEQCEYDFNVISVEEDESNFTKFLRLRDDYGLDYVLTKPTKADIDKVGGRISCQVESISADGVFLSSMSEGLSLDEINRNANEKLFDRLHDARVKAFDVFNDKDFRGVWQSIIDKYPDTAHFIYELLQNADDALATEVTIILDRNALVFKHNGTVHFSVTDPDDKSITPGHINSITGIGDSTKSDSDYTNSIGKFGIGFKSVFQYTDAPEIYDDYFKFKIVNYIVPERLTKDHEKRDPGETLFLIPFKKPSTAYKEISAKLKVLSNGTLFLHNLKKIRWKDLGTRESRSFSKTINETYQSRDILFERLSLSSYDGSRNVLMFSRNLDLGKDGKHRIYVGYYLRSDGTIDTSIRPKVHCFFPTSESFNLCMITHAPFLLVDNRQQIKPHSKTNEKLVEELGRLTAESLCELRDLGIREGNRLINENIAKIVKWDEVRRNIFPWEYDVEDQSIIQAGSIVEPCLRMMQTSGLLLSADDEYLKSTNCYKVFPKSLASLLSSYQLKQLRESNEDIGILCEKLNELDFSNVEDSLGLKTYNTVAFASDITADFMKSQSPLWHSRLYTFLNNEVRSSWNPDEKNPYFLYAPIVELTTGEWVPPFVGGRINVYSEGDPKKYNVISENMLSSKAAMKFLSDIGCKEPDIADHIFNHIIPKYKDHDAQFSEEELLDDFRIILNYYKSAPLEMRSRLVDSAKEHLMLAAKNIDGDLCVLFPREMYYFTDELGGYFAGNGKIYYFDYGFYQSPIRHIGRPCVEEFLKNVGVMFYPPVEKLNRVKLKSLSASQQKQIGKQYSTREVIIEDYRIRGLAEAMSRISAKEDSVNIWNLISMIPVESYKEGAYHYFYRQERVEYFDSSALERLRNCYWIVVGTKKMRPRDVSLEQFLEEGYDVRDKSLIELLGIKRSRIDLAKAGASKEQIENEKLGSLLKQHGISEADIPEYVEWKKKQELRKQRIEERKKTEELLSLNKEELQQTGEDSFVNTKQSKKLPVSEDQRSLERKERLLEQKEKALNDIERNEKFEELREKVKFYPKYSKEWFEALMTLEYKDEHQSDNSDNPRSISISFGKVVADPISDRVFILRNPSKSIPLEIEAVEHLEVHFEFSDREDKNVTFEVASVRDFTLRLKARQSDVKDLGMVDWNNCTRATVNANNPTELIGKLIGAFQDLGLEEGFNLKDNLQNNISFVFGPPGTGKTTYVAHKICDLMAQEEFCKILVLAPTNKACDVITEKISDIAGIPSWLGRFVATSSDLVESQGLLCNRDSDLDEMDQCCLVSTMARLPYDGFQRLGGAPKLREIDWNYVIVDEASMVPLAQIIYAIYRFSPYAKVIIAGDPLQIPPIVNEEEWKDENIYTMVHLDRFDKPQTEPIQFSITNLSTQYRSIPSIGEIFSRYSYGGQLQHNRKQEERDQAYIGGLPLKPITFIQFRVEKFDNIYGPKKLSGSNVQIYSVLLVTEICNYISAHYEGDKDLNIGVICPYVAESQMIERLVSQLKFIPSNVHFSIGTIHGFQGDECDIVFVVFNPPKGMTSRPDKIMLNKKHIINVAISRAKDNLVLLIPHKYTEGYQNLREINMLGRIILDTCQNDERQFFTSDEIEKILFGRTSFLEESTFVTSHQMANVYTDTEYKYEVRIDENSVDVQIANVD